MFRAKQIAPGSSGQVLTTSGGIAVWAASPSGIPLNGFVDKTSTLQMNGSNFEIVPSGSYDFYSNNVKYTKSTTLQAAISTDKTLHYVYFDSSGAIQVSTSIWDILSDNVPIAIVFKDGSNYVIGDERHSYRRNRNWHEWAHKTIGARYQSGFTGTFGNSSLSITQGVIFDEDISLDSGGTKTNCMVWYRDTGGAAMRVELNSSVPYKAAAGVLQWDNAGTLTGVVSNRYVNSWVFATNCAAYPIAVVIGQAEHVTTAAARSEAFPSIPISTAEWKLLYRAMYRNVSGTATYIESTDYRTSGTGPATSGTVNDHSTLINRDLANSHPASAIANTPAGRIASTDVQSALNELAGFNVLGEPASDLTVGAGSILDSVTVGESVAFGNSLYLKSDGKWWKSDADTASTMPGLRMALETKSADQTCSTLVHGRARNDAWNWTIGGAIYASTDAGALTQTAPSGSGDQVQIVGYAYHADKMIFMPSSTIVEIL